jgi:hypothetical protein
MVQDLCTTLSNTVQQSVNRQAAGNREILDELVTIRNHQKKLQEMLDEQKEQQLRHQRLFDNREALVYNGGLDVNDEVVRVDEVVIPVADEVPVSCATKQARIAGEMDMNAIDLLMNSPRLPSCSTEFPKSWRDLYSEWKTNDLQSFVKARQQLWNDPKLVQRFSKRHRAIKIIKRTMETMGNGRMNDVEVINTLDFQRLRDGYTLSKHIHVLFINDNTRTRRNRTKSNDNN